MSSNLRFELKIILYKDDEITEKRMLTLNHVSDVELRELLGHGATKIDGVLFFVDRIMDRKSYCINQLTYDFDTHQTIYRGARAFKGIDSDKRFESFSNNFVTKGWKVKIIDNRKNEAWRDDNENSN